MEDRIDRGHRRDAAGSEAFRGQLMPEFSCILPLTGPPTSADGCVVADGVWRDVSRRHLAQEPQRSSPLLALLASADGCVVADYVRLQALSPHVHQQLQRSIPLPVFATRADQLGVVFHALTCAAIPTVSAHASAPIFAVLPAAGSRVPLAAVSMVPPTTSAIPGHDGNAANTR